MAFKQDDDYNTVAERIVEFRAKYPEGSLQPLNTEKPYELVQMGNTLVFIVVAAAYRTPDDPRPGIGMAYEPIPGSTPFTRGSELQNAETAAWGRALIAVGAADAKKGIASREDVMNAREREANPPARPPQRQESVSQDGPTDAEIQAQREGALQRLADMINTLSAEDRAEYQKRWVANGLPKMKELDQPGYEKALFLIRALFKEIEARANPAAAPDHDAPPNEYMDGDTNA